MRHTERRHEPRIVFQCDQIPHCHLQDPAGKTPGVVGRVLNLSRGGAAIHIEALPLTGLKINQEFVVTTPLPHTGIRLKRVVCIVSQREADSCGKIFGLLWATPDAADTYAVIQQERLEKALQQLTRKSQRGSAKVESDFVALLAEKTGHSLIRWPTAVASEATDFGDGMSARPLLKSAMTLELPEDDGYSSSNPSPAAAKAALQPRESDSILARVGGWWSAVSPGWWKGRAVAQPDCSPADAPAESAPEEPDSDDAPRVRLPRVDARELLFGSVEKAPRYAPNKLDSADEALLRRPLKDARAVASRASAKSDVDRIYESWLESARTALTSTILQTSRSRFDFAIECYHELRHFGGPADLLRSVEVATRYLIAIYPTESKCCAAQGMLEKAARSHSETKRAALLQQAESVIESGLHSSKCNEGRLSGMLAQISGTGGIGNRS